MMTKKMNLLALLLAFIMVTGLVLAGCQPVASEATEEPAAATEAPAEATEAPEVTETPAAEGKFSYDAANELDWSEKIPVRYFAPRYIPTEEGPVTALLEEQFNFDIAIEGVPDAEVGEKLLLLLASGDMPDIFTVWWMVDVKNSGVANFGYDAFAKYMPGHDQYFTQFSINSGYDPMEIYKRYFVNDVMNQVPNVWDGGQLPSTLLARKDVLVDLGFPDTPTTIDEWSAIFAAYKEKYPEKYPYSGAGGFLWQSFTSVTNATGWRYWGWDIRDGKLIQGCVQPENEQMFTVLADWFAKGYIEPTWVQNDNNARLDNFTRGEGILVDWPRLDFQEPPYYWPDGQIAKVRAIIPESTFEYVPWPTMIDGMLPHCSNWDPYHGGSFGFGKQLEEDTNKLYRCMVFCDVMAFDVDTCLLINYGIEGEHWELDENGKVKKLPGSETAEEMQAINIGYYNSILNGNPLLAAGLTGNPEYVAYSTDIYNTVYGPDKCRLHPDTKKDACIDPDTGENIDGNYTDIFTRRDELFCNIVIGQEPVTAYSEFVTWCYDEMDLARYEQLVTDQNMKYWQ